MDRHNIRRASATDRAERGDAAGEPAEDARVAVSAAVASDLTAAQRHRHRPSRAPRAFDRPREEQTWPTPLLVRTTPVPMTAVDHGWPGRPRPAVPLYQRRLDHRTDCIVSTFRTRTDVRTVAGRRRGMTTHRRPVAIVGDIRAVGRGTEAHDVDLYAGPAVTYRRMRMGGFDRVMGVASLPAAMMAVARTLHVRSVMSPRRAVIATVAVMVLVMSAVGTSLA